MDFSRQEYWSGLPFPFPGDLPNPGLTPGLLHCRQILYHLSHQGSLTRSDGVGSRARDPGKKPQEQQRVSLSRAQSLYLRNGFSVGELKDKPEVIIAAMCTVFHRL